MALAAPLRRAFDYLPPQGCDAAQFKPGVRIKVPFGKTTRIGILLAIAGESHVERSRLRYALELLDTAPILPAQHLALLEWASRYYHHPIGEVVFASLPPLLDKGRRPVPRRMRWRLSPAGAGIDPEVLVRAPRQAALLRLLRVHPGGVTKDLLDAAARGWRSAMDALIDKAWVTAEPTAEVHAPHEPIPELNHAQARAVTGVGSALGGFQAFLLEGVTGSGKTEVYLRIIEKVISMGRQGLILIPEIGLTAQTVARFHRRFEVPLAVLHSGLTGRERVDAWCMAREGVAAIVLGTRSAVWTPLPRLGVIIVDEEHDLSYKQQDGFRYSARDVAVARAQRARVPVLLGSATPSLESLYNVKQGRYRHLVLPERAGTASLPRIVMVDLRGAPMHGALSVPLMTAIAEHLARHEQVLLFLNRRGYAPLLLCHECGWAAACHRCDAKLTYHQAAGVLRCHHCGVERPREPRCTQCGGSQLLQVGHGTERIVEVLRHGFPHARILRIDRDSTRRKGTMQRMLDSVLAGEADILVGTQMLSKGHHFPKVTLVAIVEGDHRLYGVDFRSGERMAQQVIQVAGRAGRRDALGTVMIQTHHPGHPLLGALVRHGYGPFADLALEERRHARLPPYSFMALLRAEAPGPSEPIRFLKQAHRIAVGMGGAGLEVFGPVPAPMERRAGRYRWQVLLQADNRARLQRLLAAWIPSIEGLKVARKLRWSLDVDPQEMW